jgi:hypothetical protein
VPCLAGSNHDGLRPVHFANGAGFLAVDAADDDPRWCTADYESGDVVLFTSHTIHGASPNLTDTLRLSVDYRYQSAQDTIAVPSLGPHFGSHADMPAWDELAHGWADQRWRTPPEDLTVTPMARPTGDLQVPPSRLRADA